MTTPTTTHRRRLNGVVVSAKMQKTVVVLVERMKEHPKYHKRYVQSQRYKVHDADGNAKAGDAVVIEECRPISKEKCWRVVGITAPTASA